MHSLGEQPDQAMKHISRSLLFSPASIHGAGGLKTFAPVPESRSKAIEPVDNGTFILPLKQSFMKNRRIMDSTARLIALLSGWAGQGGPIETTQGILAKHIGKSVRQIQRILQDAWREGYLTYSYTKSRIGMITGIRIYLRFERIRGQKFVQMRRKPGTTQMSDTNENSFNYNKDEGMEQLLQRLGKTMGIDYALE